MKISYFESERDNAPTQVDLEWGELGALLAKVRETDCAPCTPSECRQKYGPSWSPATFAGTRAKSNALEVCALVVDLDHLSEEDFIECAKKIAPYRYFAHPTHSDRPGDRCFRAVIALSSPVPAAKWPQFWPAAMSALGLPADPATCDASRLYFLPSRPRGEPYALAYQDGAEFDVDALPFAPEPPEPVREPPAPPNQSRGVLGQLAASIDLPPDRRAAAALLARHWPERGRHYASLELAGALARAGWDSDEIADFLTALAGAVNGDDGEPEKRANQAASSVAKFEAGEDVSGWPSLIKRGVPQTTIVKATEWLEIPFSPVTEPIDIGALLGEPVEVTPGRSIPVSEAAAIESPPIRCYPTGFDQLDRLFGGGLWTRRLVIISAPPADGKSGFVVKLARNVEIPTLLVSTELETDEMAARFAAPVLERSWRSLLMSGEKYVDALQGMNVHVMGCERLPRETNAACRAIADEHARLARELGVPPMLVVDYLQLLARGVDEKAIRGKVGDLALFFRILSQQNDCPVICVSTVARGWYGKAKAERMRQEESAEVYLSAAKESGDVDFDAAFVLFLDVEPKQPEIDHRLARIAVAKSRLGEAGFVGAKFFGATGDWEQDMAAAVALAPDGRADAKREKQENEDREKIRETLAAHPHIQRGDLRALARMNNQRCSTMVALMKSDGEVIELSGGKLILAKKPGTNGRAAP